MRDPMTVNAQQRNDVEECPLTQSDIPLIVKQVVDSCLKLVDDHLGQLIVEIRLPKLPAIPLP